MHIVFYFYFTKPTVSCIIQLESTLPHFEVKLSNIHFTFWLFASWWVVCSWVSIIWEQDPSEVVSNGSEKCIWKKGQHCKHQCMWSGPEYLYQDWKFSCLIKLWLQLLVRVNRPNQGRWNVSLIRVSFFVFSLTHPWYQKEKSEANSFFMVLAPLNILTVGPSKRLNVFHVTNKSRLLSLTRLNIFFVYGIFSQRHAFTMPKYGSILRSFLHRRTVLNSQLGKNLPMYSSKECYTLDLTQLME